ncbi:spermidine synthase [Cohnella lupini]|uniref:Spermidine synthase n=1 Tax=Cohnella lupini TaxID=1294267 RepID=A0A3D9IBN9_9BACL|nr:fused MFS/spermidine synthase [Cohnella lupini]RED59203.1 spermidine synthase [Cohnella lupini]
MHVIVNEVSKFNELTVYESTELNGKTGKYRCLKFADEAVQGAIDLKDTKRVVLDYQRAIIDLMDLLQPEFRDVFVIGHGIGTIAGHYPDKDFKVAEIDEKVVEFSKTYFGYLQDNVIVGDGRRILGQEQSSRYDYILLDAFTSQGTPLHLATIGFFEMTLEKLKPQGAILLNVMGKPKNDRYMNAVYTTFSEVYPFVKGMSLQADSAADARNIILVGSRLPIDMAEQASPGLVEVEFDSGHIIIDEAWSRPHE